MELIKSFHVCHTIEFNRFRKWMESLCQTNFFNTIHIYPIPERDGEFVPDKLFQHHPYLTNAGRRWRICARQAFQHHPYLSNAGKRWKISGFFLPQHVPLILCRWHSASARFCHHSADTPLRISPASNSYSAATNLSPASLNLALCPATSLLSYSARAPEASILYHAPERPSA